MCWLMRCQCSFLPKTKGSKIQEPRLNEDVGDGNSVLEHVPRQDTARDESDAFSPDTVHDFFDAIQKGDFDKTR